jgi:hypothetical protein
VQSCDKIGNVDEDVQAAWEAEIAKRIATLDLGEAKSIPWTQVREQNLAKLLDRSVRE